MSAPFPIAAVACAMVLWAGAAAGQGFQPPGKGEPPPECAALLAKLAPPPTGPAVFWQRTVDYRDGASPAWLVACGAGRPGAAATAVILFDDAGKVIARAPAAAAGYDSGFVVRLTPDQFALVLTSPAGRRLSSSVSVLRLDEPLAPAFAYEGPAEGALWNSVLYFVDVDDDGRIDLLIDRQTYLAGERTQQRLAYRYDERRRAFKEAIVPHGWLDKAAEAARLNPATPQAVQYTAPALR